MKNIHLIRGLETGIISGIAFGAMLSLSNYATALSGFLGVSIVFIFIAHALISIIAGVVFSYTFGYKIGSHARSMMFGILYGLLLWILSSIILYFTFKDLQGFGLIVFMPLLWAHLLYGFLTGLIYDLLVPDSEQE